MSVDSLIAAIPEFVAFVSRDGSIIQHVGGHSLNDAIAAGELQGRRLDEVWPGPDAPQLLQWVRKALATRSRVEGRLRAGERSFEVRIDAEGPNKVLCVIREGDKDAGQEDTRDPASTGAVLAAVDRRGFIRRFQQSVADAALRERRLSVCLVFLAGLPEIGRIIDLTIGEKVVTSALQRLPVPGPEETCSGISWYVGQLGEALLAVVIEGSNSRDEVRGVASKLGASLGEPVTVGDAVFTLGPAIGIALLGQDATRPQALLECARAAMTEARRTGAQDVQFYSDTMHLRPTMRLDIERELREAITNDELHLRYVGRHDLDTGRLEAIHAYLRWSTRLRGDVPPAQFLPIAENTGLALQLSQWALGRLCQDWAALRAVADRQVRISFGALRHHLLADTLAQDIESLAAAGRIDPAALEVRISEKTLASLGNPDDALKRLAACGARIVIDEFGPSSSSLGQLSQLPIHALQVDRSFAVALHEDPAAARVCRSVVGIAHGLGFGAFAAGIDDEQRRDRMRQAGFGQGLGDLYGSLPVINASTRRMRLTS